MTPSVLKLFGESYDVDTWADTLTTGVTQILREAGLLKPPISGSSQTTC